MLVFRFFPHLVTIQRCEEVSVFILGKLVGFAGIQHLPGPFRVIPWFIHLHFAIPLCTERNCSRFLQGETGERRGCRAGREHKAGRGEEQKKTAKQENKKTKTRRGNVPQNGWKHGGGSHSAPPRGFVRLIFTMEERWGWESGDVAGSSGGRGESGGAGSTLGRSVPHAWVTR